MNGLNDFHLPICCWTLTVLLDDTLEVKKISLRWTHEKELNQFIPLAVIVEFRMFEVNARPDDLSWLACWLIFFADLV